MLDVAGVVKTYDRRVRDQQSSHAAMREFEAFLRGDMEIALPEVGENEKSAIANLARQGLEQIALRTASTVPDVKAPPLRSRSSGAEYKTHEDKAKKLRQACLGWLDANAITDVLTLRAYHLFGHGESPVTVLPDPATKIPTWQARSPLDCFPAPTFDPIEIIPRNCVFTKQQTWGCLKDVYGMKVLGLKRPSDTEDDDRVTVLEYMDAKEIVWVAKAMTPANGSPSHFDFIGSQEGVELDRLVNKAERPLAFVPSWLSLIGSLGRFNNGMGAHQMRAKLLALAYLTAYKGAFPDTWIEPIDNGSTPEIVSNPDPREGTPGVIADGRLKTYAPDAGYMTPSMLSTLEREVRLDGGIPAEFGGESTSSVRTGRRGEQVLGAAVDFTIQNAQRIFERSMTEELKAGIAIVKKWTPAPKSFYVNWRNASGPVDYDPVTDFETDDVKVIYSLAGTDLNQAVVRVGQKVGVGQWSRQTAREMDPETPDAEVEKDRINSERIEELAFMLLQKDIESGQIGAEELADMDKAIRADKQEVLGALIDAHQKFQKRQADAQPPTPGVPATQPGLGAPALLPGPTSDMSNFKATLGSLYPAQAQLGA